MIQARQEVEDILYNDRTVKVSAGCLIEYNMNQMLDNIVVTTTATDSDYINTVGWEDGQIKRNPFYKLFPIDSIVKPNRPEYSGVKYYILRDSEHSGPRQFYDFKRVPYPIDSPRVYFAGLDTAYKYWVSPAGQGINLTVLYSIKDISISKLYSTGTQVVYTTTVDHGLKVGNRISVSGSGSASYNFTNKEIVSVKDSKTFTVNYEVPATAEPVIVSKTATVLNKSGVATPTKPAVSNKIVIKFEQYHHIPATCTVKITYDTNNTSTPDAVITKSLSSSGLLELYYDGSIWDDSYPYVGNSSLIQYPTPKKIKKIQIETPSAGAGNIIGVVEVSARWVKDISSELVTFSIEKESTSNPADILPVGNITANSLYVEMIKYDQEELKCLIYNRDEDWLALNEVDDFIYLAKNAQLKPHFRIHFDEGLIEDGSQKYDIVEQGLFYIDNFTISEYGEVSIECLDGAKILMDSLCPDLLYEYAPATSVIMNILDSIGFTNYNINVLIDDTKDINDPDYLIDKSIPIIAYWWSDSTEKSTVFESIQQICREIQMNAFFDENNILQFYSRDYMYQEKEPQWQFYYNQNNSTSPLASIISFSKKEIVQANQVKIRWRVPLSSLYTSYADDIWKDSTTILVAGGLRKTIEANTPAENVDFDLDIENLDPQININSTFSFSGYFLVNSEIFEYDALQFRYVPLNSDEPQFEFISNQGDWSKYRSLSKTGSQYFKPTGKYRIKRRGVFNTEQQKHLATSEPVDGSNWLKVEQEWT